MNLGSVSSPGGGFPALYRLLRDVHSQIWQGGSPYLVKGVNVQAGCTRRCRGSLALFVLHFLERERMQGDPDVTASHCGCPLVGQQAVWGALGVPPAAMAGNNGDTSWAAVSPVQALSRGRRHHFPRPYLGVFLSGCSWRPRPFLQISSHRIMRKCKPKERKSCWWGRGVK